VHGAILTEALASRFKVHIHVPTDWDLARHLGVPRPAVEAAKALNNLLATGAVAWAPQLRELLGFAQVAKALGQGAAVANLAGIAPLDDRGTVIAELAKYFPGTAGVLSLGTQR
jgi:nitric oxide reductase NorQ protein